jgi:hypothetical protein
VVVGMNCLRWDHFEVWSAPDPTSAGVGSQILSHILGIRSKSSILNLAAGSFGYILKGIFCEFLPLS